jgi:hypothetical protein
MRKQVWHLFEGSGLFKTRLPSREGSSPAHLARMISLLGPPPPELLDRGTETTRFFDENGRQSLAFVPHSVKIILLFLRRYALRLAGPSTFLLYRKTVPSRAG